jgi:GTP-binding protein
MKFVDQVSIQVKAGDGGNGAIAFRREKYVERGGPSGGDGGNGGSVIFVADPQLTTLLDYRYQPLHRAKNGQQGMGSDCNGAASDDMVLRVPVGTLIKDEASGETLVDMSEAGQRWVAAKGGRGGLGNMNFATSTRQTPRFAQDGTPGEERALVLELKLLADVGLLGFPNAGKSTLISRVSRARPKVADYPFTTLVPNLGMVQYKDGLSFVMADIPGLIEGASEGAGLGLQFLRHVERCRVLIHLIDLSAPGEDRAPLHDFDVLNRELARYSPELAKKPQIVAANKVDLPDAREKLAKFTATLRRRGILVYPVSSATGEGVQALLDVAARVIFGGELPRPPQEEKAARPVAKKKPVAKKAAAKKPAAKKPARKSAKKPAAKKPARAAKGR